MKNNTMCRLTAFAMAMTVICASAASCGAKNDENKKKNQDKANKAAVASNDAELAKTKIASSMKAVPIDLDIDFDLGYITSMVRIPDSGKIVISASVQEQASPADNKKNPDKKEKTEDDEILNEEETATEKAEDADEEKATEKAEEADGEKANKKAAKIDTEGESVEEEPEKDIESEDEFDGIVYKQKLFIADPDFNELKELNVDLGDENGYLQLAVANNGTLVVLQSIDETPEDADEDEDFDYEAGNTTYKFFNIDTDGNIISETELEGLEEYAGSEDFYTDAFLNFGNDKFILGISDQSSSAKAVVLDMNGKILDSVETDGLNWLMAGSETSDGKYVLCGYTSMGMKIKYFDTEAMAPAGEEIELTDSSVYNINSLMKGEGDYILYANTMDGICGIKADGSYEEFINWADCDLDTSGAINAVSDGNGGYIVYAYSIDGYSGSGSFYRLVERAAGELDNTKIVTIGTLYDDYTVSQMISKFNKEHDDIRMKAVNYEKYNDYDEETEKINNSASRQLKLDIIAGKAPDMIVTYDRSVISSLAAKNVFTDLYGLMDDDLKKDDIIDNVLESGEIGGKLLSISPSFYVTTLACKTKYCDKENWTFEDMKETYESLPDGMGLCQIDSNEAVLQLVLPSLANCIDYENSTCNFDTPEFKAMIEFCAQFPDTEEIIDWKNASDEEMNEFTDDMEAKFKEDRALLANVYLSEFRDYKRAKQATFDDEITLVGTPSSNGEGAQINFDKSFAILDSSDVKAECWEFIKNFFTEEAYKDDYGFPTVKKYFDDKVENAMEKRTYTDENGEEHEIDDSYFIGNTEIKIDPLTEEEKDYIVNYVKNVKAVSSDLSDEIAEMGMECLKYYFKGEKTLDEAIELLQSKVSIYLSEQS